MMMHKYKWSVDMGKILLLEDDESLNRGISLKLKKEGYEVLSATGVAEAKEMFRENEVDLIISDISMEDGNGLEFGQSVRKVSDVYLIFLTALDQEVDIVNGYDAGADDYITKPFSLMVLRARVNSVLRRRGKNQTAERNSVFRSGELVLDFDNMNFAKAGQPVILSRTEQKLLRLLVSNRGQVLSKELLLDRVWGTEYVDDHALTVTVKRLRDKLGTGQIKSIYGIGYRWEKEDE